MFIVAGFLLTLLFIGVVVLDGDLLSPTVLLLIAGFVCSAVCLMNYTNWNLGTFNIQTVLIIITGTLCCAIPSTVICARKKTKASEGMVTDHDSSVRCVYKISNGFTLAVIIVDIAIAYIYYREIVKIGEIGRSLYAIKTYPTLWYVHNIDTGVSINPIVSALADLSYIFGYVYLYLFIVNVAAQHSIKNNLLSCGPIVIYAVQSVMFGGRTGLLQIALAAFVLTYIVLRSGYQSENCAKVNASFIRKGIPMILGVLVAFFLLNNISGRVSTGMSWSYYISVYLGSGLKNLDSFIVNNNSINTSLFGGETFGGIYTFLKRFGLCDGYSGVSLPYEQHINGLFLGNTYTCLRRYYSDFGPCGILIMPAIVGVVIGLVYKSIRAWDNKRESLQNCLLAFKLIAYSILSYALLLFYIEDFFFLNVVSVNYLLRFLGIYIALKVMMSFGFLDVDNTKCTPLPRLLIFNNGKRSSLREVRVG